jgi:hypothetical protein
MGEGGLNENKQSPISAPEVGFFIVGYENSE